MKIAVISVEELLVERPEDGVLLLKMNRPQARNALNRTVRQRLAEEIAKATGDEGVRVAVLTGTPEFFAAGADLQDLTGVGAVEMMLRNTQALWQTIADFPKPLIAAVNGYALGGGCELAMHADIIVAGEGASFGQPEVRVGLMPGAGGTQRLTRAVGKFKAMKMVLTGAPVSAREADAMGLVSEVVADAEVLDAALKIARQIARMPPLAVRQIKEVLLAGQDAPLSGALMLERKAFQLLFASEDTQEGIGAFLEKRRPSYKGV